MEIIILETNTHIFLEKKFSDLIFQHAFL